MSKQIWFFPAILWLAALHLAAVSAGFLAPSDYAAQNRSAPLAPPTQVHFADSEGRFHPRPFVCRWAPQPRDGGYSEDCSRRFPIRFFVTGVPYKLLGLAGSQTHLFGVSEGGAIYLMGTDDLGRDQFARFLYGAQVSLLSGMLASGISITLGIVFGALAGYYRGWLDGSIMGAADLSLALPWLYLLFAARALLPLNAGPSTAFFMVVAIVGIVGWARPARLIRSTVLTATEREYVLLAKSFGGSDLDVLGTHVVPQIRSVVLTQASLLIPRYVLAEVVLSFLGLGVSEPAASWGNMLGRLQQYSVLTSCWWMFLPAALLLPTFLSYGVIAAVMSSPNQRLN